MPLDTGHTFLYIMEMMLKGRRYKTSVIFCFLLLVPCLCIGGTDFQHWSNADAVVHLNEAWIFKVENQFRFSDSEDFFQHHTDFGFTYTKLAEWLDLGVNYRFIRKKGADGDWEEENRPHLNFTLKGQVFNFKVNNRIRLEYNDDDDLGDFGTFRNKITLNPEFEDQRDFLLPIREEGREFLISHNIRPFASYEFFVDTETNDLSRQRFYVGASVRFTENLVGDLYYMFEYNSKFGTRDNVNVVGLALKFLF